MKNMMQIGKLEMKHYIHLFVTVIENLSPTLGHRRQEVTNITIVYIDCQEITLVYSIVYGQFDVNNILLNKLIPLL